jgi:molybdopterin converting factor small subunit
MVEVKLWGALSAVTGGKDRIDVEARDIRELFRRLAEDYPGVEPYVKQGIAVSIDGQLYRDDWSRELPKDAEIFLLPRMSGG